MIKFNYILNDLALSNLITRCLYSESADYRLSALEQSEARSSMEISTLDKSVVTKLSNSAPDVFAWSSRIVRIVSKSGCPVSITEVLAN